MRSSLVFLTLLNTVALFASAKDMDGTFRYLRLSGSEYREESIIEIQKRSDGISIKSVTQRGKTKLVLSSRFDADSRLEVVNVSLETGDQKQTATVVSENGKATVTRKDGSVDVLDCPANVIVTSAPDWTDCFLLAQHYNSKKSGQQDFAGLWIHPTRQPLRLTFKVEETGKATVFVDGEQHQLVELSILLRNNSRYTAWRDDSNDLVRLIPKGKPQQGIVLAGWKTATASLTELDSD